MEDRFQDGWRGFIHAIYFTIVILPYVWKAVCGRWFIFRDAPDWIVEDCACLHIGNYDPEKVIPVLEAGYDEWLARVNRRIMKAIKELESLQ